MSDPLRWYATTQLELAPIRDGYAVTLRYRNRPIPLITTGELETAVRMFSVMEGEFVDLL